MLLELWCLHLASLVVGYNLDLLYICGHWCECVEDVTWPGGQVPASLVCDTASYTGHPVLWLVRTMETGDTATVSYWSSIWWHIVIGRRIRVSPGYWWQWQWTVSPHWSRHDALSSWDILGLLGNELFTLWIFELIIVYTSRVPSVGLKHPRHMVIFNFPTVLDTLE